MSKYGCATVDGFLGHIEGEGAGVFGWVHSRKASGKTLVSTQSLINNNAEVIADYSGAEAYKRSVKTYGGESSAFLTPGTTTTQATDGSASAGGTPTTPPSGGGSGTDESGGSDSGGGSGSDTGGEDYNE